MNDSHIDISANHAPELYSFISYRQEQCGGYLFNPYLFREIPLTDFELAVVEKCNGKIPLVLLPVILAREFRTDRSIAEQNTNVAIQKLRECFAIKWSYVPDDVPVDIGRGPRRKIYNGPNGVIFRDDCLSVPLSIIWEVTHACNLSCLHCLSACGKRLSSELTNEEAKRLIDTLAELKVFSMTMGGGEPLMRDDIFDLIEYCTRKNLAIRLSTNGYDVTPETIKQLADLNVFSVQISVDGMRESHDLLRNRQGAYDHAIEALRLFSNAGYHTFMTVTASAMNINDIPKLLDIAVDLGVATFKVSPYVPIGRAANNDSELRLTPEAIRNLAEAVYYKKQQLGDIIYLQGEGLFTWLLDPDLPPALPADSLGPGCSAGISQVVISYDGEVYPCPYMRDRSAGNIREASLLDIWNNDYFFSPLRSFNSNNITGKCASCKYLSTYCSGGCRGAAMAAYGDLYAEDPFCWYEGGR